MMGERRVDQGALFYEFSLDRHVPADHLLRRIDRFVELGELRSRLGPFYSSMGRPSIDPELLIRMLLVGARPARQKRDDCGRLLPASAVGPYADRPTCRSARELHVGASQSTVIAIIAGGHLS